MRCFQSPMAVDNALCKVALMCPFLQTRDGTSPKTSHHNPLFPCMHEIVVTPSITCICRERSRHSVTVPRTFLSSFCETANSSLNQILMIPFYMDGNFGANTRNQAPTSGRHLHVSLHKANGPVKICGIQHTTNKKLQRSS